MTQFSHDDLNRILNNAEIETLKVPPRIPKSIRKHLSAMSKIYEPKDERESFGIYDEMAVRLIRDGKGIASAHDIKAQLGISTTKEDRLIVFDDAIDVFQYILMQTAVAEIDDAYRITQDNGFVVCLDNTSVPTPRSVRRKPFAGLCPKCREPELWIIRKDDSEDPVVYRLYCQHCNCWINDAPIPIIEK